MKQIRYGVFETNSSSTHSITLETCKRKSTRTGNLVDGARYSYSALGQGPYSSRKGKIIYKSEYEKFCVMCDMIFNQFCCKRELGHSVQDYNVYSKRAEKNNLGKYINQRQYQYQLFLKSDEYKEIKIFLKNHRLVFDFDADFLGINKNQRSTLTLGGYFEDFEVLPHFNMYNVNTLHELLEKIVYNPALLLVYEYDRG